jgi:hypothetical protein
MNGNGSSENGNGMNPVEIKFRRKLVEPFFAVGILLMVSCVYGVFFTEKYKDDTRKKLFVVGGIVFFGYGLYAPIKKLLKNQPIIVLADDSIVLHEKQTVVIPKRAIQKVEVVQDEDRGYVLHIETEKQKHETGLTWLDTTPDQMKILIERYKR